MYTNEWLSLFLKANFQTKCTLSDRELVNLWRQIFEINKIFVLNESTALIKLLKETLCFDRTVSISSRLLLVHR